MTNCNEFTHQLESKLQWTGYKALTLFFPLCPSIAHRYLVNLNALKIATETLQKAEYQQTLPAY